MWFRVELVAGFVRAYDFWFRFIQFKVWTAIAQIAEHDGSPRDQFK